jgi:hypothetical protein
VSSSREICREAERLRPSGDQFGWFGHENNPCAGAAFFSPDQTAGFLDTSPDLVFTTFVSS